MYPSRVVAYRRYIEGPKRTLFWDLLKCCPEFEIYFCFAAGPGLTLEERREEQEFLDKFKEQCRSSCPNFGGFYCGMSGVCFSN
jgi:hypothetical protein